MMEPKSRNYYENTQQRFWNHMSGNGGVGNIPGECKAVCAAVFIRMMICCARDSRPSTQPSSLPAVHSRLSNHYKVSSML
jgi:hypothetical protein